MVEIRDAVFFRYLCHAPMALAMERSVESTIYRRFPLVSPVLDLGCGEGLFAEMVFKGQIDTGLDPDRDELQLARQRGKHRELIQASGDRIPKSDNYYKTIVSNSVLEHIPNLLPVLKEVQRVLHPDGNFYCTVPSEYFDRYSLINSLLEALGRHQIAQRYRRFFNAFWKHYHYHSLPEWIDLVVDCGFEVQVAFTFNPRKTCILNDMFAPLGIAGLILKRVRGKWILFPQMRSVIMRPIACALAHRIKASGPCLRGGLVFMSLKKSNER